MVRAVCGKRRWETDLPEEARGLSLSPAAQRDGCGQEFIPGPPQLPKPQVYLFLSPLRRKSLDLGSTPQYLMILAGGGDPDRGMYRYCGLGREMASRRLFGAKQPG